MGSGGTRVRAAGRSGPAERPAGIRDLVVAPIARVVRGGNVLALGAAALALALNWAVLRSHDPSEPIVVLAAPVPAGSVLTLDDVRIERVTAGPALLGALLRPGDLDAGRWVATRPLAAGDPLRHSDLRAAAAPGGLRAMSIPLPAEHAVAGALVPGDRVDVIVSSAEQASYLLVGAEVLAVEDPSQRGLGAVGAFSVTIAVDAESALRVALAVRDGDIAVVRATGAPAPASTVYRRPAATADPATDDPTEEAT